MSPIPPPRRPHRHRVVLWACGLLLAGLALGGGPAFGDGALDGHDQVDVVAIAAGATTAAAAPAARRDRSRPRIPRLTSGGSTTTRAVGARAVRLRVLVGHPRRGPPPRGAHHIRFATA